MAGAKQSLRGEWRQGDVLPSDVVYGLRSADSLPEHWSSSDIIVVVSHSCDLSNDDYASEPYAELLRFSAVSPGDRDGSLFWGKNPRRLQLELEVEDQTLIVEAQAHERERVDRRVLQDVKPDHGRQLNRDQIQMLSEWIGKRYYRRASPDEFNRRLSSAVGKVRKSMRAAGTVIVGLYFIMDESELPPEAIYSVEIIATMRVDDYDDVDLRTSALLALDSAAAAIDQCGGVEVVDHEVMSEADFSVDDWRNSQRVDLDDLSYRRSPMADRPPEG